MIALPVQLEVMEQERLQAAGDAAAAARIFTIGDSITCEAGGKDSSGLQLCVPGSHHGKHLDHPHRTSCWLQAPLALCWSA
jgi:hypothetical protein